MGVESGQSPRGPTSRLAVAVGKQTHEGGLAVSKSLRGRLGSWSRPLPLSLWRGLEYQPAHQRTHNKLAPWLACNSNSKTYQHLRKLAVQRLARWELPSAVPQHGPSLPVPHPPVPASLGGEAFRFAKCRIPTCIDSHATDEPRGGFVFVLSCFVDSDSIKGRTQRRLRALHSVEGRGREGIPTPISSCWQTGRSGRDGVMLQGAPVSTHLVGLSDRAWFRCRHQ